MTQTMLQNAPDLRNSYPRSPNELLGGFVLLPRIIDKCRAVINGTNGEYNFNCPLDRRFFDAFDVDAEGLKAQVAAGKTDSEILDWVNANRSPKTETEIMAWNYQERTRRPETPEMMAYYEKLRLEVAPDKPTLETWFQVLDADEKRV